MLARGHRSGCEDSHLAGIDRGAACAERCAAGNFLRAAHRCSVCWGEERSLIAS